ncbi:glucosamine-6-phosphate deaminase [Bacillus sp. FJAT-27916]|uniref:glucosamine-6-phosphate deaminase n=1 Tax=Bacillaceae TaxID=186817 RepID=UPI000670FFD0|nr:glucosamine-6-phosphate deaminase [Bacillus sp. FJAT-27916]KMY46282.1 glucosamine-6-phosphate deaminase [Bacillus sp. FJAT-27916]
MKIIVVENYDEMSKKAAEILIKKVQEKPNAVLGLATGSTPVGLYKELIEDHQQNGTSYKDIHTVNLDEYIGLPQEDKNSYFTFMYEHLFKYLEIPKEHTHIPSGDTEDHAKECKRYEEIIESLGQVDLQILGIGSNGHIGFNEPGTPFTGDTHIIDLKESTRQANARFFESIDEVPTQAITMGIGTIMKSKEILLLASGKAKAEAIHGMIHGEMTEELPASILQSHPHVTLIVDKDAYSLCK